MGGVQYVAHQCNCLTRRSAGFAHEVFDRFPEANIYAERPDRDYRPPPHLMPGNIVVRGRVINMLAQYFPGVPRYPDSALDGRAARLRYFAECLVKVSRLPGIESVAFPWRIGCNMAGGDWDAYRRTIDAFADLSPGIGVFLVKKS